MRLTLACLLLCTMSLQAQHARTLALHLRGDADRIAVQAVFPKRHDFRAPAGTGTAAVELLDRNGVVLARVPFDPSPFNLDRGARRGRTIVHGDHVHLPRLSMLVKVPDLASTARLRISLGSRVVGTVSRAALDALVVTRPAASPTIKTLVKSGPVQNRYDIVVIGDGYQKSEEARFDKDVAGWMSNLFAREPFKTYKGYFNVHSVFRASKDSGVDHPKANPPVFRDTVYDGSYGLFSNNCLYIQNRSQALRDAALAPDVESRVVVFINDQRFGGCGGVFAVSYNGRHGSDVQSHEFGHAFGGLADEYVTNFTRYTGPEPREPNVTAERTCAKWRRWLGHNGVGCWEGGRYYSQGIWRPKAFCTMSRNASPWCEVCIEHLTKRTYETVTAIDDPRPTARVLTVARPAASTLQFKNIVPRSSSVTWFVNDRLTQVGGDRFHFASSGRRTGHYTVRVDVFDATPFVRQGQDAVVSRHTWTLRVRDPRLPDLGISTFVAPASARPGGKIVLETVVTNRGGAAAGAFRVESFVSRDPRVTVDDVYLGGSDVPALAANASLRLRRDVTLPVFLERGTWSVASQVDRVNAVEEDDEANNLAVRGIAILDPQGCPTRLEVAKPLTYPFDEDTISLGKGGISPLVLTAPCRRGHFYLVLWGCSGTRPGTPLPPAWRLPLNLDACTSLGLSLGNQGPFFGFFGRIDAGRGQAWPLVDLPKGIATVPFTGHLAAVLIDPGFRGWTGVTNAVRQIYSR